MAKDPAMLWYWGDWYSGTSLMSRFLKGCYMDLLHAQFNTGRLSIEEIRVCLGSDFGQSWPAIQKKFKQDGNGLFFNERLEQEKEKRKAFSKSRKDNVEKRYSKPTYVDTSVVHMNLHMENENTVFNNKEKKEAKSTFIATGFKPGMDHLKMDLTEMQIGAAQQYLKISKQRDVTPSTVVGLWEMFKMKEFTGEKYYNNGRDIYTHFINGLKYERLEQNQSPTTPGKIILK